MYYMDVKLQTPGKTKITIVDIIKMDELLLLIGLSRIPYYSKTN